MSISFKIQICKLYTHYHYESNNKKKVMGINTSN